MNEQMARHPQVVQSELLRLIRQAASTLRVADRSKAWEEERWKMINALEAALEKAERQ